MGALLRAGRRRGLPHVRPAKGGNGADHHWSLTENRKRPFTSYDRSKPPKAAAMRDRSVMTAVVRWYAGQSPPQWLLFMPSGG